MRKRRQPETPGESRLPMEPPSNPVKTPSDQFSQTRGLNSSLSNVQLHHPPANNQTHLVPGAIVHPAAPLSQVDCHVVTDGHLNHDHPLTDGESHVAFLAQLVVEQQTRLLISPDLNAYSVLNVSIEVQTADKS